MLRQHPAYTLFYRQGQWIYIGESGNIRDRLLEHIRRQENQCIVRSNPTHFAYELVAAVYRVQRQNELIAEFAPPAISGLDEASSVDLPSESVEVHV